MSGNRGGARPNSGPKKDKPTIAQLADKSRALLGDILPKECRLDIDPLEVLHLTMCLLWHAGDVKGSSEVANILMPYRHPRLTATTNEHRVIVPDVEDASLSDLMYIAKHGEKEGPRLADPTAKYLSSQ